MTTDKTDAFIEGYIAGYEVGVEAACPYKEETFEYDEWELGWMHGEEDYCAQDFWRMTNSS